MRFATRIKITGKKTIAIVVAVSWQSTMFR